MSKTFLNKAGTVTISLLLAMSMLLTGCSGGNKGKAAAPDANKKPAACRRFPVIAIATESEIRIGIKPYCYANMRSCKLTHTEPGYIEQYRQELEDIYAVISPSTSFEEVRARVGRLVNIQDNSFSEKASVLNARLEELLPKGLAEDYKIQGYNGHPRRVPLNPLFIHWSGEE